jgi:hypothetical protein
MIREFGKPDTPVTIDNIEPKPQEGIVRLDEGTPVEDLSTPAEGLRPFHVETEEDTQGNNTAKIIGGVVVGLLIIGGGIYAYESSRSVPAQQVALKTPAVNHPALDQTAAAPPAPEAEATTPDSNATPQPATAPVKPKTSHVVKSASNPVDNSTASAAPDMARSTDPAINAPMTLTPENAPAPEQTAPAQSAPVPSAPTGQTAMQQPTVQQPVIAPDVNNQTNAPMPSMATNTPATDTPTSVTPSGLPTAPLAQQSPAQQQLTQMENQPAPQPQPAPAPAQ